MYLNDGLKVVSIRDEGEIERFGGQISVSSGTHRCLDQYGEYFYPNEDWKPLNPDSERYQILTSPLPIASDKYAVHHNVFVFSVDEGLCRELVGYVARNKAPLEGLAAKDLVTESDVSGFKSDIEPIMSEIQRFIAIEALDNAVFMNHHANRRSTTLDSRNGHVVGLHIDNFDAVPLDERDNVGTRVCVNLGPGPRYLWLVNLSLRQIVNSVAAQWDIPAQYYHERPSVIGRKFLELNPDYGVFRIRFEPGMAYMAPTQQYMHDGSTAWSRHEDNIFFLRGRFGLIQ